MTLVPRGELLFADVRVRNEDAGFTRLGQQVLVKLAEPGGVLGVTDYRPPQSMPRDATTTRGYAHESYVIKIAERGGLRLAGESEINADPKDKADHKGGVWALPPPLTNVAPGRNKYQTIGERGRMTLKFVKP